MSKFIYKDTLQTKYNEGTILTDDVKCKTLEVNKITSDNPFINIDKNINLNGDLSVSGDINIDDLDISTIKTNTITSDNSKIDFNKGINTTKYLSIGNNNYNITTDGGLCLGNFAASPYNDGVFKIGIGTGNNDRQTGLLFDNNGTLNVKNKIITNDLQSKNGNNIIKLYDNSIEVSKDGGTNWTGLISAGAGTNAVILNNSSTNTASGDDSYTEGSQNTASGNQSHAEGFINTASGNFSHAEGRETESTNLYAHAEGYKTHATGISAHAEGYLETTASGQGAHAEGGGTKAKTEYAHSEGVFTTAEGSGAHAEGFTNYGNRNNDNIKTWAYGRGAHAEGVETQAKEEGAHSEGYRTKATGFRAHAEGYETIASGNQSHASGRGTYADQINMTAIGSFNTQNNTNALFVVGNGDDNNNRSDAFVVYKNGNILFNNNLFKSGTGNSQFLTYIDSNDTNTTTTRAISNENYNYYIIGDIVNINVNLQRSEKYIFSYINTNTSFWNEIILNIDLFDLKQYYDNKYNATTSTFYLISKGDIYFYIDDNYKNLKYTYEITTYMDNFSPTDYAHQYDNGLIIYFVGQEGSQSTNPPGKSNFIILQQHPIGISGLNGGYNSFNIQLKYKKLT